LLQRGAADEVSVQVGSSGAKRAQAARVAVGVGANQDPRRQPRLLSGAAGGAEEAGRRPWSQWQETCLPLGKAIAGRGEPGRVEPKLGVMLVVVGGDGLQVV
jgi:hypothetical protein